MLFKSIRFKMIAWAMVVLTVTITAFSIVLYKRLSYDLYRSLDDLLQSRADGIADSIDTFWEVEKLEAKKKRPATASLNRANELNFAKIAELWVHEEANAPELFNIIIQIFDAKGQIIATSKNTPEIIIFPKEFFSTALQGNQRLFGAMAVNPGKAGIMPVAAKPVSGVTTAAGEDRTVGLALLACARLADPRGTRLTRTWATFDQRATLVPVRSLSRAGGGNCRRAQAGFLPTSVTTP